MPNTPTSNRFGAVRRQGCISARDNTEPEDRGHQQPNHTCGNNTRTWAAYPPIAVDAACSARGQPQGRTPMEGRFERKKVITRRIIQPYCQIPCHKMPFPCGQISYQSAPPSPMIHSIMAQRNAIKPVPPLFSNSIFPQELDSVRQVTLLEVSHFF